MESGPKEIQTSFNDYLKDVYIGDRPISEQQRLELERAWFAAFYLAIETIGQISSTFPEDEALLMVEELHKECREYVRKTEITWRRTN